MAIATENEAATALKVQGNKAFAQHDWPTAIDFYTKAIEKNDKDPSFFCNRAQVCPRQNAKWMVPIDVRRQILNSKLMAMRLRMLLMR